MRPFPLLYLSGLVLALLAGCSRPANSQPLDLANRYFQAKAYEDAKRAYLQVLQQDPEHPLANARLGQIWFDQGAPIDALPFLIRARNADPKNGTVRNTLAHILLALGRTSDARAEALAALQTADGKNQALLQLAQTFRTHAEYQQTAAELRRLTPRTAIVELATATLLNRRNDPAGAKRAVERALKLDPQLGPAHAALAALLTAENNLADAKPAHQRAAELSPVGLGAHLKYVEFLTQKGEAREAIAYLETLARQRPDYIPTGLALAQIALAEKRYPAAQTHLAEVLKRWPTSYEAHLLRAQCRLLQGEKDAAIQEFQALAASHPGFFPDKLLLARAYLQQQDVSRAIPLLEGVYHANPDQVDAALALAQLHLREQKPGPAVELMITVLMRHPTLAPAQQLLGAALRMQGRADEAVALVKEQLRAAPQAPELHYLLGLLQVQQNNRNDARVSFEQAHALDPEEARYATQLIELHLRDNDVPGATKKVNEFLVRMPDAAELHFVHARVLLGQRRWSEAEAALSRTLELNPNYAAAYDLLVYGYVNSQQSARALAQLESMLSRQPNNLRALLLSGMLHAEAKDYAKSRDHYERLLTLQPKNAVALNNLASLYSDHFNELDRAVDLARKARELEPDSPAIADTLGWTLVKRKDYKEGLELIAECATRMPENPEVQFHLGVAHQMLGQKDAARTAFNRALASPAEFTGKAEIATRLAQLGSK